MKASPSAPPSVRLADYGALLRRRWRIILGACLSGLLAGITVLYFAPPIYTATASVLVSPTGVQDPTPLANGRAPAEINLDTEAQIATSSKVARIAQERHKSGISDDELLQHVSITVPPNSAILKISYHAPTPIAAQRGSQAFATAYLRHRKNVARASVRARVEALREKIRSQTAKIDKVSARLSVLPDGSSTYLLTSARRDWLTQQVSALNARVSELTTTAITPGSIISGARLPSQPSGPSLPLHATTGLMSGFLLGLVAAQVRDRAMVISDQSDLTARRATRHAGEIGSETGAEVETDSSAQKTNAAEPAERREGARV